MMSSPYCSASRVTSKCSVVISRSEAPSALIEAITSSGVAMVLDDDRVGVLGHQLRQRPQVLG